MLPSPLSPVLASGGDKEGVWWLVGLGDGKDGLLAGMVETFPCCSSGDDLGRERKSGDSIGSQGLWPAEVPK